MSSRFKRNLLVFTLLSNLLFTFIFVVSFFPPEVDFSILNPSWNGYSRLTSLLNASIIYSDLPKELPKFTENTILLMIPTKPLTLSELESIKHFVESGGKLVLMDDYGYGNQILEYLDAPIRIWKNVTLIDPLFHYKNGILPKIYIFIHRSPYLNSVNEIVFNQASVLNISSGANILAWSSLISYLDMDSDFTFDLDEPEGAFPVIASFKHGSGEIIVISDSSLAINGMIDLGDNLVLLKNLASGRKVILDQSHIPETIHLTLMKCLLDAHSFLSENVEILILLSTIIVYSISMFIKSELRKK